MDVDATVEGLRPYLIHGERYAVVYFSHDDDPDTIHQAQFSDDALPPGLRVGEKVRVQYVVNVVAGIRRRVGD